MKTQKNNSIIKNFENFNSIQRINQKLYETQLDPQSVKEIEDAKQRNKEDFLARFKCRPNNKQMTRNIQSQQQKRSASSLISLHKKRIVDKDLHNDKPSIVKGEKQIEYRFPNFKPSLSTSSLNTALKSRSINQAFQKPTTTSSDLTHTSRVINNNSTSKSKQIQFSPDMNMKEYDLYFKLKSTLETTFSEFSFTDKNLLPECMKKYLEVTRPMLNVQ